MKNVSSFRAMYGTDLERLDYSTVEGVKSLFDVTVTGERTRGVFVRGTQTGEHGGEVVSLFILRTDVEAVYS